MTTISRRAFLVVSCKGVAFLAFASASGLITALILKIPQPQVYDFEGVPVGLLEGHDNWPPNRKDNPRYIDQLRVVAGTGLNRSHVLHRNGWGPDIIRRQDRKFSFQKFSGSEKEAVMQFDIRYGGPLGPSADGYFSTGGEAFGLNNHSFSVLRGGNLSTPSRLPERIQEGDWIRLQLRFDFTARHGLGVASLFYKDLTARDADFRPVQGLQNIELTIRPEWVAKWDHLRVNIGSPLDRIAVDNLVPNMSSSSHRFERLLALSLACGIGAMLVVWREYRMPIKLKDRLPRENRG